jgi:hypothetical protein
MATFHINRIGLIALEKAVIFETRRPRNSQWMV